MSNPETHTCPTCGYVWLHGKNGSHNCNVLLLDRIGNLRLELNRLQEISKRQGEITAINMEDFIKLTDELKEANEELEAYKFNLQSEKNAVREVSDMLVSRENKLKEAIIRIECRDADIRRLITYSELRDSQLNDANSAIKEIDSWIPGLKGEICNHEKSCEAIDRALKESTT